MAIDDNNEETVEKSNMKSDKEISGDLQIAYNNQHQILNYNDQISAKFGALNAEEIENINMNNEDMNNSVVLMNGQINPEDFINGMTPPKNRKDSYQRQKSTKID